MDIKVNVWEEDILLPDGNGRPVMEINGLRQKETPEI